MSDERPAAGSIALVGMMGSGKSAVGARVAARLGIAFRDTDHLIEQQAGRTVAEIFAADGEATFRAHERRLIDRFGDLSPTVLALGGGMFVGEENVSDIRAAVFTVWLRAGAEVLLRRMGDEPGEVRPLLQCDDPLARLRELLAAREPWYARAHAVVDVDELEVDAVAAAVIELARGRERCE
jgi:shikimate kinase